MMQQIEQLYTENLTATAYKARIVSILAGLHNFSNPTRHTRLMIILRALIFSTDPTTQTRSARMLKAYLATRDSTPVSHICVRFGSGRLGPCPVPDAGHCGMLGAMR